MIYVVGGETCDLVGAHAPADGGEEVRLGVVVGVVVLRNWRHLGH